MCRKLLLATAVAMGCLVGVRAQAAAEVPDGTCSLTGITPASWRMSDELAGFLGLGSPVTSPSINLSSPIQMEIEVPQPHAFHKTFTPRLGPESDVSRLSSSEYPLVPLPPPFWTGSAGLAGLAVVGFCKRLYKGLR